MTVPIKVEIPLGAFIVIYIMAIPKMTHTRSEWSAYKIRVIALLDASEYHLGPVLEERFHFAPHISKLNLRLFIILSISSRTSSGANLNFRA